MNLSHVVNDARYRHSSERQPYNTSGTMSASYSTQQTHHYGYMAAPPSPPMEDNSKCSLPSISSLLGVANQGPAASIPPQQQNSQGQIQQTNVPQNLDYRPVSNSRGLPPTPPMQDLSYDGRQSPSASSQYSVVSAPQQQSSSYFNNMEGVQQRHQAQPPRRVSYNGYAQSQYAPAPQYYGSVMPNHQSSSQVTDLYYQRPLPPVSYTLCNKITMTNILKSYHQAYSQSHQSFANPFLHHHHIPPSAATAYPQSQDRYACAICNKKFSRPSSLRIHSHSHTGEKPFPCPQPGCSKAFSVRSNMKRHEKSCRVVKGTTSLGYDDDYLRR